MRAQEARGYNDHCRMYFPLLTLPQNTCIHTNTNAHKYTVVLSLFRKMQCCPVFSIVLKGGLVCKSISLCVLCSHVWFMWATNKQYNTEFILDLRRFPLMWKKKIYISLLYFCVFLTDSQSFLTSMISVRKHVNWNFFCGTCGEWMQAWMGGYGINYCI